MPALDFPSSPTLNQVYTANGRSWIWNGSSWNAYFATNNYVLKSETGSLGPTNLWIGAGEFIPRTTSGCGVNSLESSTNKINYDVLEFDAGNVEYAQVARVFPNNYTGSPITFNAYWTATGSSGSVVWQLGARAFADDNMIDQAIGAAQNVADAFITGNDLHITATSPAITITGSPLTGKLIVFEVSRLATTGTDTLAIDAQLIGVSINY